MLLTGPPGIGKTMLSQIAANLQPSPTLEEQIEIAKAFSLCNLEYHGQAPYRSPHHSASLQALIGGGPNLLPGEIALANHGILFLDELPEFNRQSIEALRQPLESHSINITRADQKFTYPADFQLIATANPCPCGYYRSNIKECTCTCNSIQKYQNKISGPLLDRIDLYLNIVPESQSVFVKTTTTSNQEHETAKCAIAKARLTQYHRSQKLNARLSSAEISNMPIAPAARNALELASARLQLSARKYFSVLKVARTIADLAAEDIITPQCITEALYYQKID